MGKNYVDEPHEEMKSNFLDMMKDAYKVDISIGIFGIRNLRFKSRKPRVSIGLSNEEPWVDEEGNSNYWILKLDDSGDPSQTQVETFHPTFGGNYMFKGVTLAAEPLLWPYIVISVIDDVREEAIIHFGGGCETCFTTIHLLDYLEGEEFKNISLVYERA